MKKPDNEITRLIRIVVIMSIVLSVLISAFVFWVSIELTTIKRSIHDRDQAVSTQLEKLSPNIISKEIAALVNIPSPVTPQDGKDGRDGIDGKNAVSTHTVIEKQTVIQEQLAIKGDKGDDGKDAKEVNFGITTNGKPVWKWSTDREWQLFTVVDIEL